MAPAAVAPPARQEAGRSSAAGAASPRVLALQPMAIVDHVITATDETGVRALGVTGDLGGSSRVSPAEIAALLERAKGSSSSAAGGSTANTARGLAGMGIGVALLAAAGGDEWGSLYVAEMRDAGVDVSRAIVDGAAATAQCAIVASDDGSGRTMRTCTEGAARVTADSVVRACREVFGCDRGEAAGGSEGEEARAPRLPLADGHLAPRWFLASGYALYSPGLLEAALGAAKEAGASTALDLASFEVVRSHRAGLRGLFERGLVDVAFGNEDEVAAFSEARAEAGCSQADPPERGAGAAAAEAALTPGAFAGASELAGCCRIAVVTAGVRGCVVATRGPEDEGDGIFDPDAAGLPARYLAFSAASGVAAVDATGAGDLFEAGFLAGLCAGQPIAECARLGCLAGGAVVQASGPAMTSETWAWFRARRDREA